MNPLVILFWVLVGLILLAGVLMPFVVMLFAAIADIFYIPARVWVASSVISVISIVAMIWVIGTFVPGDDEASHCGPGTHYVYQDHLVGKTIDHEWMCTS